MKKVKENQVEQIYLWGLVKGSNDDEIGNSKIAEGILFITKTINEINSVKHYMNLGKNDKAVFIYEGNNEYDYDEPIDTFKDCLEIYNKKSNSENILPPLLGAELLDVAINNDPDEFCEYENLRDELLFESADSSYFSEIEGFNQDTGYIGAYSRSITLQDTYSLDITDKEKIEKLASKLLGDVYSLSDLTKYDSYDEAEEKGVIEWTGVHLVPFD